MYRFIFAIFVVLAGFLCGTAANVAQVTVNGAPVRKSVTEISFSGDKLTVRFDDSDSMDADMEAVLLSFAENGMSAVEAAKTLSVFTCEAVVRAKLTVSGLSESAPTASFDPSGKVVFGPVPAAGRMEIKVAHLSAGVYMLRSGNDVVKFTKH